MTIPLSDLYDFTRVCTKIRHEVRGEIIAGSLKQDEFFKLQKKQIDQWCKGADNKVLKAIKFIGPQVTVLLFLLYSRSSYSVDNIFHVEL